MTAFIYEKEIEDSLSMGLKRSAAGAKAASLDRLLNQLSSVQRLTPGSYDR